MAQPLSKVTLFFSFEQIDSSVKKKEWLLDRIAVNFSCLKQSLDFPIENSCGQWLRTSKKNVGVNVSILQARTMKVRAILQMYIKSTSRKLDVYKFSKVDFFTNLSLAAFEADKCYRVRICEGKKSLFSAEVIQIEKEEVHRQMQEINAKKQTLLKQNESSQQQSISRKLFSEDTDSCSKLRKDALKWKNDSMLTLNRDLREAESAYRQAEIEMEQAKYRYPKSFESLHDSSQKKRKLEDKIRKLNKAIKDQAV